MWPTVTAASLSGLVIVLYWRAVLRRRATAPSLATVLPAAAGLVLCALSTTPGRTDHPYAREASPLAVAVAFDVSPSMLAIPDPTFDSPLAPRFERARAVLLRVFTGLEERGTGVMVSSLGFTRDASVVAGWSGDAAQIREVLEHGLVPGLFTRAGTSVEAGVDELLGVFDMLPQRAGTRRVAILVSDGEDTTGRSWLPYTLDRLSSSPVELIALQAGALEYDEGVPRYGELGEFLGFERMGGALYTVPDAKAMHAIAGAARQGGLYVRAEDPAAAEQIVEFLDSSRAGASDRKMLTFTVLLFVTTALLCARILR